MQERGDNSYVVVYFKINLRKDAEAHEQNWIKIREFVISLTLGPLARMVSPLNVILAMRL